MIFGIFAASLLFATTCGKQTHHIMRKIPANDRPVSSRIISVQTDVTSRHVLFSYVIDSVVVTY
jgi:hypothetical protein